VNEYQEYLGWWTECRDGTIGEIVKIDKAGYCELRDTNGEVVKRHEPLNRLKTEKEDPKIYFAGVAGKHRR
jgi:hypothetical protein